MFLRSGFALSEKTITSYNSGSLFDSGGAENQSEKPQYVLDQQKYMERYTESYALQKFGAMWMDYLYTSEAIPTHVIATGQYYGWRGGVMNTVL